jgi:hypothetical protein
MNGNTSKHARAWLAPGHKNGMKANAVAEPMPRLVTVTVVMKVLSGDMSRTIPVASRKNTVLFAKGKQRRAARSVLRHINLVPGFQLVKSIVARVKKPAQNFGALQVQGRCLSSITLT